MKKTGIIVFANDSGLGYQTVRLTKLIRPDRILAIDSSSFSKNKKQHFEWYEGFGGYKVDGFPSNHEIKVFLRGLTHVLVCENPLNYHLTSMAKKMGIKVFIQTNWEFNDFLNRSNIELPYMFLMPSHWKVKEMKKIFGDKKVKYLPPPLDPQEFLLARNINFKRNGQIKLLHVIGTLAAHDRNGTLDLLKALSFTDADFQLDITSQHDLPQEYITSDKRVRYLIRNMSEPACLYEDCDAMIFPRRYGGLSLTMNEALMSGLPVIMTRIDPNTEILPKQWLVNAQIKDTFFARTEIDVYETRPRQLAQKIDWLISQDLGQLKTDALEIAYENFSYSKLKNEYEKLWTL